MQISSAYMRRPTVEGFLISIEYKPQHKLPLVDIIAGLQGDSPGLRGNQQGDDFKFLSKSLVGAAPLSPSHISFGRASSRVTFLYRKRSSSSAADGCLLAIF